MAPAAEPGDGDLPASLLGGGGEHEPEDVERQDRHRRHQQRHRAVGLAGLRADLFGEVVQVGESTSRSCAQTRDVAVPARGTRSPRASTSSTPAVCGAHQCSGLRGLSRQDRAADEGLLGRQPGVVGGRGVDAAEDARDADQGAGPATTRRHAVRRCRRPRAAPRPPRRPPAHRRGRAEGETEVLDVGLADQDLAGRRRDSVPLRMRRCSQAPSRQTSGPLGGTSPSTGVTLRGAAQHSRSEPRGHVARDQRPELAGVPRPPSRRPRRPWPPTRPSPFSAALALPAGCRPGLLHGPVVDRREGGAGGDQRGDRDQRQGLPAPVAQRRAPREADGRPARVRAGIASPSWPHPVVVRCAERIPIRDFALNEHGAFAEHNPAPA